MIKRLAKQNKQQQKNRTTPGCTGIRVLEPDGMWQYEHIKHCSWAACEIISCRGQ